MKPTILLVEDNQDDEGLTVRALKKRNLINEVILARDGEKALVQRWRGKDGHSPVKQLLMFLDLNPSKIAVLEVLCRLRADDRLRFLPILIMNSSDEERDLIKGYGDGSHGYIRKSVGFHQFLEATIHIDLNWLALNQSSQKQ